MSAPPPHTLPSSVRDGAVLAIDIGGTKTKVACYHAASGSLRRSLLDTHQPGLNGRAALQRLIDAARGCAQSDAEGLLLGVAVVLPGIVQQGRLWMAPNAPELEGMDLRDEFAAAFGGASIILDNDVKAGCLAEQVWGALHGFDQALYVNIGTGLAAAAIINGEVYRGRNGAALEIGYQLSPSIDLGDSSQWTGWRDNIAPMETLFSGATLDQWARRTLGAAHGAKDLFLSNRPGVQQGLRRRLNALAAQLVNLSIAFDVEAIAIGGGVSRQYSVFGGYLEQLLQRLVPFPPTLLGARFAYDAPLWGALELARRALQLPELPDSLLVAPAAGAQAAPDVSPASAQADGVLHDEHSCEGWQP